MRKIGRGWAAAMYAERRDMDDSEDLLKVPALKWLADTGKLEQLQKQCAGYTAEAGKVKKTMTSCPCLKCTGFVNV